MVWAKEKYILLDVLVCIAKYFYECCRILASPQSRSKYKLRVKYSAILHIKLSNMLFMF